MKERAEQKQVEASALDRAVEAATAGIEALYDAQGGTADQPDLARAALQAADDHLREHYWAEFRERLEGEECIDAVARDVWQKRNQHPWEKVPEKFKAMLRDNTRRHLSVLATTQHKGGSQ